MTPIIALVGKPNCGKTTLFNALTRKRQPVGNWQGVTVEKAEGIFQESGFKAHLVDLPGCESLEITQECGLDQKLSIQYLQQQPISLVLQVIEAQHLNEHLDLTLQLLTRGLPLIIVLNMMDEMVKKGLILDPDPLSLTQELQCPVIPITAIQPQTLLPLKQAIVQRLGQLQGLKQVTNTKNLNSHPGSPDFSLPMPSNTRRSDFLKSKLTPYFSRKPSHPLSSCGGGGSCHVADNAAKNAAESKSHCNDNKTNHFLDRLFLHRFWGLPLFFGLMYLCFLFTIQFGVPLQGSFEKLLSQVLISFPADFLTFHQAAPWLINFISRGLGQGLVTTGSFIPVVGLIFFCISLLEASGYLVRIAQLMNRFMLWADLPGKAFIPLVIGFGCNVPAVLSARTLENPIERLKTIMMSSFVSCSGRLSVYALFAAAFFPTTGQNIIFSLYIIGILFAFFTGFLLKHVLLLKEDPQDKVTRPLVLPPYRWPSLSRLLTTTYHRVKSFIMSAGLIIVPLCVLLAGLGTFKTPLGETWLQYLGKQVTPLLTPMGIEKDNWPATVGLLTGLMAKEVVVGTLTALYSEEIHQQRGIKSPPLISNQPSTLTPATPIPAEEEKLLTVSELMVTRFGGGVAAFTYLLFVLLYLPCISVLSAITRELNVGWAAVSAIWSTTIAYATAVLFYQTATWAQHPLFSSLWISGLLLGLLGAGFSIRFWAKHRAQPLYQAIPTKIVINSFPVT